LDKTIVTALLLIAGIISVILVFNAIYPAINQSSDAMLSMQRRLDDRFESQIEIVHATAYGVSTKTVYVWVKNIGAGTVSGIERCDVFFGPETSFSRIPFGTGASYWSYTIENDTTWKPTATIRITIDYVDYIQDGERYFVKVVLPNGISAEHYFSK
jgi:archaellum component FlaF (FlaF/FlaG flagellin family)